MLAFIYLAYSMMTLLLEIVLAFEDTWIECLGDLARLDALQQLLYYGKSLAVSVPFTAARKTIMTLFEPTPNPVAEQGYCIAISNCIALLSYSTNDNPLALLLKPQSCNQVTIMSSANSVSSPGLPPKFTAALRLFIQTTKIHLLRIGSINTLSFLYVTLNYLVRALNALKAHFAPNPTAIKSPILEPDSTTPLDPSQETAGAYNAAAPAKSSGEEGDREKDDDEEEEEEGLEDEEEEEEEEGLEDKEEEEEDGDEDEDDELKWPFSEELAKLLSNLDI
ncbi:hypothetical protein V496_01114 [Pseudogymnoascus sp. VKM F-4515 (FW-2607)]|nr:hypothetical protein V496_01114 [Pseudogymnoascus sp. VKM F-4515 (FW-2607)]